jgi:hypothetical protein
MFWFCQEVKKELKALEEFYLAKTGGKNPKKSRTSATSEGLVEISFNETKRNPGYETFVIGNCSTSSAFDTPKDNNNNNVPQTIAKPQRVKKGKSDGTPLTTKLAELNGHQSTGAKPKKLVDITSMHNVEEETFKIPANSISYSILKPLKSMETTMTLNDFDESMEVEATTIANYPKWSWNIKKALEADRYGFKQGEIEAKQVSKSVLTEDLIVDCSISLFPVVDCFFISGMAISISNPKELFPDSNYKCLVRSDSTMWGDSGASIQ